MRGFRRPWMFWDIPKCCIAHSHIISRPTLPFSMIFEKVLAKLSCCLFHNVRPTSLNNCFKIGNEICLTLWEVFNNKMYHTVRSAFTSPKILYSTAFFNRLYPANQQQPSFFYPPDLEWGKTHQSKVENSTHICGFLFLNLYQQAIKGFLL